MKTNINIAELVEAFRAEAQEKIGAERTQREERDRQIKESIQRCVVAFQEVWPKFEEVIHLLPGGRVVKLEDEGDYAGRSVRFSVQYMPYNTNYTVERIFCVWEQGGKFNYHLGYGKEGGFLMDKELPPTDAENPADILVILAKYAGACKARKESQ